jgi:type II secretory pathway pseudopilin PulG
MRREQGFSYLIAMFLVATLAVLSVRAIEDTLTGERRAREAELLSVGQAYRNAIRAYYERTPGTVKRYPRDLQALLEDQRTTIMARPLRRAYRDPITASSTWGLVMAPDGGVMGVYSLSTREPIKLGGFSAELSGFANAKSYQDWKFVYRPT